MGISIKVLNATLPLIETERLRLRGFALSDAPDVQRMAGDRAIAAMTSHIPHPYPAGEAARWISTHAESFATGESARFAVTLRGSGLLVGAIGLEIHGQHNRAEVGYWIGHEHWGQGYASEALIAVLGYGFSRGLHRIWAEHFAHNPASGRVMQKAGMKHEGTLRHHMVKWGEPVDCEV